MKRFWTEVAVDAGRGLRLDERPVRTPGRAPVILPSDALAEAVAAEWRGVGETLDPRAMPLTGLANAAIDRIAPDPATFAAGLARYAESDLLCYRAPDPPELAARQAAAWNPPLAWAEARYGVRFELAAGVMHVAQPAETITRLSEAIAGFDPFRLAGLYPIVTITGSLVLGLAVAERALDGDAAWSAAAVDDAWQAERWGEDALAAQAAAERRTALIAGADFIGLLDD